MEAPLDCESLVAEYEALVETACARCDVPELATSIKITWNNRFTARMGDAHWVNKASTGLIRLSRPLWPKATIDEQVETVIHEACHIIADYKVGRRMGHGPVWREMMRRCGITKPRRCHSVNDEAIKARRQGRRVPVRCGCPTPIFLSRKVALKILRGTKVVCTCCRQRVEGVPEHPLSSGPKIHLSTRSRSAVDLAGLLPNNGLRNHERVGDGAVARVVVAC